MPLYPYSEASATALFEPYVAGSPRIQHDVTFATVRAELNAMIHQLRSLGALDEPFGSRAQELDVAISSQLAQLEVVAEADPRAVLAMDHARQQLRIQLDQFLLALGGPELALSGLDDKKTQYLWLAIAGGALGVGALVAAIYYGSRPAKRRNMGSLKVKFKRALPAR